MVCCALLKLGNREWLQILQNRAENREGREQYRSFYLTCQHTKVFCQINKKSLKTKKKGNSVSKCNKHHSLKFNCLKILVSFTGLALIATAIKYILYGRKKHSCTAPSAPTERMFQQQSNVWAGFQITWTARSLLLSEGMNSSHPSPLSSPARPIHCRELTGELVMPTYLVFFFPSNKACETVQSLSWKAKYWCHS